MNDFNGKFSLFPAKEKKSEKSPDYTGTLELSMADAMALAEWLTGQPGEQGYNGETIVKVRLAGWKATSRNGMAYLNGKVSPPMPQQASGQASASEDMPF
jgi:uncharacterized protein (DUF736 family)